jgi:hypothetical protein
MGTANELFKLHHLPLIGVLSRTDYGRLRNPSENMLKLIKGKQPQIQERSFD